MVAKSDAFGDLGKVTPVRRVGNVCVDRDEERALRALVAALDPKVFGNLNLLQPVRHPAD